MSPSKPPFKDITVLSTLALKGALQDTVQDLRVEYHATQALLKSIAEGASADVVILTAEGIDIVGPLPDEVQGTVALSGAVMAAATKRAAAQAFLDFLGTAAVQEAMRKNYLMPAPRSRRRPG